MHNFWERYEMSYRAFSQHCDSHDWRNILEEISLQVINIDRSAELTVLDVGSGTGRNIEEILEIILSKTRVVSVLDIVEPSEAALNQVRQNLLPVGEGGFLRRIFQGLSDLTTERYDAIILMHSSYYIVELISWIKRLLDCNLKQNGKIIILSLPSTSTFFMNREELQLPNTSDGIKNLLEQEKIPFHHKVLNSRFQYVDGTHDHVKQSSFFYEFMTGEKISSDDFNAALNSTAVDGNLNFKDELIIITKNYDGTLEKN